jgi:hypothetical protein
MTRPSTRQRGYIEHYRPQKRTQVLLAAVDAVLEENRAYWPLALRQVYYQLGALHGYPKNETFYARLGHHLGQARRGRRIPFEAIRDDGVTTVPFNHYADADAFLADCRYRAENFQRDVMARQDLHIEVWCEAAGMIMQLARVTEPYSIPVYSSSGFDSITAKYDLAQRICRMGRPALILHVGDYDPSGEKVFEAIAQDVSAFVRKDRLHAMVQVEFRRVALTREQVAEYDLPTVPAKVSTHSREWKGETCQLEALPPAQIAALLEAEIVGALNHERLTLDWHLATVERERLTTGLLTFSTAGRSNEIGGVQ